MEKSCTISGVNVRFPCKPYPTQIAFMDKILKGLQRQENCLLESPTGTGKSLALLCSALAWQSAESEKLKEEEKQKKTTDCECCCHVSPQENPNKAADNKFSSGSSQVLNTEASAFSSIFKAESKATEIEQASKSVIIVDSDDDDFKKVDSKQFKSAVSHSKKRKSRGDGMAIRYEDGGTMELNSSAVTREERGEVSAWTMELNNPNVDEESKNDCQCCAESGQTKNRKKVPRIYFGTRTHKQVAQIIREFGRTVYKNKRMTILSSREHTCIHPDVSSNSNKAEECKNLLDGTGCHYYDRVRRVYTHESVESKGLCGAWDIEDLVMFGKKHKGCPYFGARQLRDTAEIIFCPYNYLIDPAIRNSMEIKLAGQIVIFDEAHNIEDSSREAASLSVSQSQLIDAINALQVMVDAKKNANDYEALRLFCVSLSQMIDMYKEDGLAQSGFNMAHKVLAGPDIIAQFKMIGLSEEKFKELKECYNKVMAEENDSSKPQARGKNKNSVELKLKSSAAKTLDGLFLILEFIIREKFNAVDDYRIAIVKTMEYQKNQISDDRWLNKKRKGRGAARMEWNYVLNFWCMNPAVAFTDMCKGVRSVVLTSGTLSPMSSFQSELGVTFPIQFEANHVISPSQVWVGSISRGPNNQQLLGSYQNSETLAYQDEIGAILLDICQIVPYGVLCFLSSYNMLDKLTKRWQATGLWRRLEEVKVIVSEPRTGNKENFEGIMTLFYQVIRQCSEREAGRSEEMEEGSDEEATSIEGGITQGISGALFFAICRGKVSEGLDFTDNNARAVVTVGIPYPNIKDTQVELKKQYNDARSRTKGLLCGRDWYEIQAYRAINQALGRCIRHRYDWGALVLIDERFGLNPTKYVSGLSKWVRQNMKAYSSFTHTHRSLIEFCQARKLSEEATLSQSKADMSVMALNETSVGAALNETTVGASLFDETTGGLPLLDSRQMTQFIYPSHTSTPVAHGRQRLGDIDTTAVINSHQSNVAYNIGCDQPLTQNSKSSAALHSREMFGHPDTTDSNLHQAMSYSTNTVSLNGGGKDIGGLGLNEGKYLRISQAGGFLPESQYYPTSQNGSDLGAALSNGDVREEKDRVKGCKKSLLSFRYCKNVERLNIQVKHLNSPDNGMNIQYNHRNIHDEPVIISNNKINDNHLASQDISYIDAKVTHFASTQLNEIVRKVSEKNVKLDEKLSSEVIGLSFNPSCTSTQLTNFSEGKGRPVHGSGAGFDVYGGMEADWQNEAIKNSAYSQTINELKCDLNKSGNTESKSTWFSSSFVAGQAGGIDQNLLQDSKSNQKINCDSVLNQKLYQNFKVKQEVIGKGSVLDQEFCQDNNDEVTMAIGSHCLEDWEEFEAERGCSPDLFDTESTEAAGAVDSERVNAVLNELGQSESSDITPLVENLKHPEQNSNKTDSSDRKLIPMCGMKLEVIETSDTMLQEQLHQQLQQQQYVEKVKQQSHQSTAPLKQPKDCMKPNTENPCSSANVSDTVLECGLKRKNPDDAKTVPQQVEDKENLGQKSCDILVQKSFDNLGHRSNDNLDKRLSYNLDIRSSDNVDQRSNVAIKKQKRFNRSKTSRNSESGSSARSQVISTGRKTKGVNFIDEDMDHDEDNQKGATLSSLKCPTCHRRLISTDKELRIETNRTQFWKDLWQNSVDETTTASAVVISTSDLRESTVSHNTNSCTSDLLNSHWSATDGCCIQPLYCSRCLHRTHTRTLLGAVVRSVSNTAAADRVLQIEEGQVWLNSRLLKPSSAG